MGLSWVEVSQVNPSLLILLLFFYFYFYPLTLGYWVLRFLIFYVFPFYGVILGRELVKLTRCDLGFFFPMFIFYLTSILFFTRLFKKKNLILISCSGWRVSRVNSRLGLILVSITTPFLISIRAYYLNILFELHWLDSEFICGIV